MENKSQPWEQVRLAGQDESARRTSNNSNSPHLRQRRPQPRPNPQQQAEAVYARAVVPVEVEMVEKTAKVEIVDKPAMVEQTTKVEAAVKAEKVEMVEKPVMAEKALKAEKTAKMAMPAQMAVEAYGAPVEPIDIMPVAARSLAVAPLAELDYEVAVPPIYEFEVPVPPIGEIPVTPVPPIATGPQIQPPRPTGPVQPPTGPQIQPPRPTGPVQPPRPTGPSGPQIQPPRPPRPTPPRPTPPRPQPQPVPVPVPPPPASSIPPLYELPSLDVVLPPRGQSVGRGRCLGPQSRNYATQLQQLIRRELTLYLNFTALADSNRRWRTSLQEFATESLERARLLAAAYYSITRRIYWPTSLTAISSLGTLGVELRRLDSVMEELEYDYRVYYRRSLDVCLGDIYLLLADDVDQELSRLARLRQRV